MSVKIALVVELVFGLTISCATFAGTSAYDPISSVAPGSDYLKYYEASGKPRFDFSTAVSQRFGARLDRGVDPTSQTNSEWLKWQRIYNQLKTVADRTQATPKSLLLMDPSTAKTWSENYEKTGVISSDGAWSIAVGATAVRHGFSDHPCAEFVSEMIREAYVRAGYRVTDDFNEARDNVLIWFKTAEVENLANALVTAGWIPWDTAHFQPITGAILMNQTGRTPGHTFLAAGLQGRLFIDNASPEGRDLGLAPEAFVVGGFRPGVFFLPPGINPPKWQ